VSRSVPRLAIAALVVLLGAALAAAGVYVGETDDAPGAALIGFVLLLASLILAWRIARR
jgi:hypothetical protein